MLPGEYRGSADVVEGNREGELIRTLFQLWLHIDSKQELEEWGKLYL